MERSTKISDRTRATILRWLKRGSIDNAEYRTLLSLDEEQNLTDEELHSKIDKVLRQTGYETCRRCQRLNLCEKRSRTR